MAAAGPDEKNADDEEDWAGGRPESGFFLEFLGSLMIMVLLFPIWMPEPEWWIIVTSLSPPAQR